ncbi:MAG: ABC transporter ATP-binding protein, partial [Alphaproteobacteria bacterium]
HGIATLHITHDQEEALSIADRVAVMDRGRLVQVDTPRGLYDRPATRAIAAFVGQANLWPGIVDGEDRIRVPFGEVRAATAGHPTGTSVTVLVRPERVVPGPSPDGVNSFSGRMARDRFLGSVRRYDIALDGATLLGETSERASFETVHFPPADVRLLPA